MAAKKKRKGSKEEKLNTGREMIQKLWSARPARQWLGLLKEIAPNHKWQLQGEHTIKGCCPYHIDNTPSFSLSFKMRLGKCFGSCGRAVDDLVAMVRHLKDCSYAEALLFIQQYLNLGEELGKYSDEISYHYSVQKLKRASAIAFRKVAQKLVTYEDDAPDKEKYPELAYLKPAMLYLTKGRGINKSMLTETNNLPVGLFAKPEHVKRELPPEWHEMYDEYFAKYQSPNFWGSVIFHYNDSPSLISRFKLRMLDKLAVEKVAKNDPDFKEVSQEQAKTFIRKDNSVFIEDPFTNQVGVLGLFNYQHLLGHQSDPNVYITEGEFDVLSVMNAQAENNSYDFILLATSGVGSLDVGFLRDYGVRTVWLIPDHPAKHGDAYARQFLAEKGNFVKPGSSVAFAIKIFQWPVTVVGFDLDETIQQHGYDRMRELLVAERNASFMNANLWIKNKCDTAITKIKKERDQRISAIDTNADDDAVSIEVQNLRDDARKMIHETILEWFQFIHDPTERLTYAQKYATQEDIDITQDSRVHSDVYALDSWDGVIRKITDAFKEQFEFAYYKRRGGTYELNVWSKDKKEIVPLPETDSKQSVILSMFLGQDFITWIEKLLSGSVFWDFSNKENPMLIEREKLKQAAYIMNAGIRHMVGGTVNKQALAMVSQGIHHFGLPMSVRNKGHIYFVNGNKVFRGVKSRETDMVEWEYVNNCVAEGLLFTLIPQNKWSYVDDVADLYAASKIKLEDIFEKVKILLNGWAFDNHDVTVEYLAAQIMALPVAAAIGNVNITYITGESESGKTSLLRLLGGTKNPGHDVSPILEAAEFAGDTTPAGMYQKYDRASIGLVYDEAEVSENHSTKHDKQTQELQRIIMGVPQGGVPFSRGGQTQDQRVDYFVRMPIIMAGINLPTDKVLLSRTVIIYTKKEYGHRSLSDYISDNFTQAEIDTLRREITVALLPYIPDLVWERKQLKQELNCMEEGARVSDRYLDNIITPLIVYKLAGKDYRKLFSDMFNANKDRLERIHGEESTSDLVNACLYNEAIKITNQDGSTEFKSARQLIIDEEFVLLNNAGCGVYYYPAKNWIVIFWRQAKYTVLKHDYYGKQGEDALKERVAKTRFVVREVPIEEHQRIKEYLALPEMRSPGFYTVVKMDYLMENVPQASETGDNYEGVYESIPELSEDQELPPVEIYGDDDAEFVLD